MSDNFYFRRPKSDERAVTEPSRKKRKNLVRSSIVLFKFSKMNLYNSKKEMDRRVFHVTKQVRFYDKFCRSLHTVSLLLEV